MADLPVVTRYDADRFRALAQRRVRARGRYEKQAVTKRPGGAGVPDLTRPGTVKIALDDGYALMLEIYYAEEGSRPVEEIQRFHGKRVEVVGTLWEFTPTALTEDGHELQTMINAHIHDVESIAELPA